MRGAELVIRPQGYVRLFVLLFNIKIILARSFDGLILTCVTIYLLFTDICIQPRSNK